MTQLIQKGFFLDLEALAERIRPLGEEKGRRYAYVTRQFLTNIEDLTIKIDANAIKVIDFGTGGYGNLLQPLENQIFQCFFGFFPDAKCYLEHPIDVDYSKTPKERPGVNWRTGVLRQSDSTYTNPELENTEFYVVKGRHIPRFHFKEIHGRGITVWLRVMINMLVVEPVVADETISQLERRIKPSTPVYLKAFEV